MPQRPKQAFLSYARENADQAKRLKNAIAQTGVRVWFDQDQLLPGQRWQREIEAAIKNSDYFLILLSNHSVTKRGVVQHEVREALRVTEELPEGMAFIIPVRLEPVVPLHPATRKRLLLSKAHSRRRLSAPLS